ncbi:MAG TPA: hypothetical protein VHV55_13725 [Pirellulales bacterium]|nr:hypothetical protein [Pirellulales bacterium]
MPTLDPAILATLPFLPPPDEGVPPTAARFVASNPLSSGQSVPTSVRDILPLLSDAAPGSPADGATLWRQQPGSAADSSHSAAGAASGSTWNERFTDRATRPLPEITVSLGEGHRMATRVLATKDHKIEALAREQCKNEIHRSFSLLRADMRANFR